MEYIARAAQPLASPTVLLYVFRQHKARLEEETRSDTTLSYVEQDKG